ncbi:MAG: hypothetical protein E7307_01150 [Butyrivibrio sp.]|nr:hypothetical protein [Butyrivibrio sp.]
MDELRKQIVEKLLRNKDLCLDVNAFSAGGRRIAAWNMPQDSYAYQDIETQKSVEFVFEDNLENQDESLKLILQCLKSFDACVLCISWNKLSLANDLCDYITEKKLDTLAIGIVTYDQMGNILINRSYKYSDTTTKERSKSEKKSYWCWWRDASQYEVAVLLELSSKYDDEDGDIYTEKVYPKFFEMMINKETKQWDGTPRNKKYSEASYKAEKQNYKIPMCQLGLWEPETGHITEKGRILLEVSKRHGDSSNVYMNYLAKMILIDGKHLDLIKDLDEFQKSRPELVPETSVEFFILFDDYMEEKNSLGTRKPSARTTGAKKAYVRDEPKLWNKFGIINSGGKGRYFIPFKGIDFNWDKINEILMTTEEGITNA